MATNKVLADGVQPSVLTAVTLYTAPGSGNGTRVIAFTATNSDGTTDTYDLHIVPSGGSADSTNRLVSTRSIKTNDSDIPAEVQNHLIPASGKLQVLVSAIDTIAFRATGIEF